MAKKSRQSVEEEEEVKQVAETKTPHQTSSDIFKSLFANSSSQFQPNPISLFSNNPYRRKPTTLPNDATPTCYRQTPIIDSKTSDSVDPKKRKWGASSETPGAATGAPHLETGKKSKMNGFHVTGDEVEKMMKKKKKRKRDEIEEEYERRMFGDDGGEEEESRRRPRPVVGEKRKAEDVSKELIVSKEGFDDDLKLQRTVFVGNLPVKVKRKSLVKEFKQFGEIESIRIRSVPIVDSKMPRKAAVIKGKISDTVDSVHAYIVFKNDQSAHAALSHNMAKIGENHIRVDRACPPCKKLKGENAPLYDDKRTVFVGNLPFDVKDEELYRLFSGADKLESTIEAIRVIRDPNTSLGKGIAYVLFKTRDAAHSVVKKKIYKLRDRDLRLSRATSDSTPSKRKNAGPIWQGNSPAKRLAVDSSDKSSRNDKSKSKAASLSYQGLRASKSGAQKKVNIHSRIEKHKGPEPKSQGWTEPKVHETKRPAVAARKARAKRLAAQNGKVISVKSGADICWMGKKRKQESRTPESFRRNKKARKF